MGYCDQKTTEEILDFFYENGGMLESSSCPLSGNREDMADLAQATSSIQRTTTNSSNQRNGLENG